MITFNELKRRLRAKNIFGTIFFSDTEHDVTSRHEATIKVTAQGRTIALEHPLPRPAVISELAKLGIVLT